MVLHSVACGCLVQPAQAAIFDRDDREYVSPAIGSPYAPIGIVTRGLLVEHHTTGVLVDECDVLTSQHILPDDGPAVGKRLKFIGAVGTAQQMSTSGTVIAAGGLTKMRTSAEQFERRGRDWLLLRLDKCFGATLGFVQLRAGPFSPAEFRNLQSAGYPEGRSNSAGVTLDPSCRVTGSRGTIWLDDCATMPGNSGGPIFRMSIASGKPQLQVYAIETAGVVWRTAVPFAAGYENQATPVGPIVLQIRQYLLVNALRLGGSTGVLASKPTNAVSDVGGSISIPLHRGVLGKGLGAPDPQTNTNGRIR